MPRPETLSARLVLLGLLAAVGAPAPAASLAADLDPQRQIESRLMCYCGCADLTIRTCTCGTAAAMRQEIAQRLADSQTAEQVVAAFVARHGEKILSAPTLQGFNLMAWIMPFAVLFVAGTGVVLFVRRRGSVPSPAPAEGPGPSAPARGLSSEERELMQRVEREIREGR